MIEYRSHLLSRVRPDSEIAYQRAIKEAIETVQERLLKLRVGVGGNTPDNTWTRERLNYIIKKLQDQLKQPTKDFIKNFQSDLIDIITIDNKVDFEEFQMMVKLGLDERSIEATPRLFNLTKREITAAVKAKDIVFVYRTKAGGDMMSAVDIYSYYKATEKTLVDRIRSVITSGIIVGDSPEKIARALPPQQHYAFSQLRTLVRTTLAESSNSVNVEMLEKNKDAFGWWQYVATLDTRTTRICRDLDGRRWSERPKKFTPPLHFNCRSALIPIPEGFKSGQRPMIVVKGDTKITRIVDGNLTFKELEEIYPELKKKNLLSMKEYKKLMNIAL